ncbi:stanniocalcin-2 [Protobothrops mucrosquamatus]|uniref:stanniocalcin-2 n=1 Tax=Protobothrops mucrosquamatus TaxID=103944 RepID=UPI00077571BE|nr:stanniocalcin-2 [Protobothrops mucrosquamatus]
MCAECLRKLVTLALVFASVDAVVGTEATHPPEGAQDRAPQQKGRMSLQNSAEIQHCLVSAGDVGCSVFECFENNSCEIRGLHEICMTFLHNAGKFDAQGKSFIKDALRCKAHALRHKFSCISRKCPAIKEMVFQLQRECYQKHDLCSAAKENVQVIVEMIHFKDLLQLEPYVDLVNILLTCGEEVKEAITQSVQTQCEQNWGSLCSILSLCTVIPHGESTLESEKKPNEVSRISTGQGNLVIQPQSGSRENSQNPRGERGSRLPINGHTRTKSGGHNSKATHETFEQRDEPSDFSDIRR